MNITRRVTRRVRRRSSERGTATAFVVGIAVTLLMCAGLVADGGTALNARMKLADDVEQAARSGAQEIDELSVRGDGAIRLDPERARTRAASYVNSRGYRNAGITVDEDTITVQAKDTVDTKLLGLIGINSFDVSASATSEAVTR